jgi:hypothetical protein
MVASNDELDSTGNYCQGRNLFHRFHSGEIYLGSTVARVILVVVGIDRMLMVNRIPEHQLRNNKWQQQQYSALTQISLQNIVHRKTPQQTHPRPPVIRGSSLNSAIAIQITNDLPRLFYYNK